MDVPNRFSWDDQHMRCLRHTMDNPMCIFDEYVSSPIHRNEYDQFNPSEVDSSACDAIIRDMIRFHDKDMEACFGERDEILRYLEEQSTMTSHRSVVDNSTNASFNLTWKEQLVEVGSHATMSTAIEYLDGDQLSIFKCAQGRSRRPLLHEFIRMLLDNSQYSHIAEYIDRKHGIFRLKIPKEVARLWKVAKGRHSKASKSKVIISHVSTYR
jgi:hypothetical protein